MSVARIGLVLLGGLLAALGLSYGLYVSPGKPPLGAVLTIIGVVLLLSGLLLNVWKKLLKM